MRFVIISHTPHCKQQGQIMAYGPYVKEMNLWIDGVEEVLVVAPLQSHAPALAQAYVHDQIKILPIPAIALVSLRESIKALVNAPRILYHIYQAMKQADHIHLRCPGNIGLLGCMVQLLFPKTRKTAKYAGNWDPLAKQPRSYKFQKWILSNTLLTKNMKVLVYGEWPDQSENIHPFFTASYRRSEIPKQDLPSRSTPYRLLFVGSLVPGKQPSYALELTKTMIDQDIDVQLDMYGDGPPRAALEAYTRELNLEESVTFHGNQSAEVLKTAYQQSHFLILPSRSEGWPKVVAEALFWGCIPAVTPISCVPWMLKQGERGILLSLDLRKDAEQLIRVLKNPEQQKELAKAASNWSRQYTLDQFQEQIRKLR
ncbi:glycosyltransferase family 4 protein [Croceiramulus getboli]|nr:glycosyltransferase family 4 protein [Flavobacteriaceae bacterium YJPT1-3]